MDVQQEELWSFAANVIPIPYASNARHLLKHVDTANNANGLEADAHAKSFHHLFPCKQNEQAKRASKTRMHRLRFPDKFAKGMVTGGGGGATVRTLAKRLACACCVRHSGVR